MNGREAFDGFDFYDDAIFDEQIDAADFFKLQPVIFERHRICRAARKPRRSRSRISTIS
jgi:hypothetical protein